MVQKTYNCQHIVLDSHLSSKGHGHTSLTCAACVPVCNATRGS